MKKKFSGGVLVVMLFLVMGFFGLGLLVVNIGQAGFTAQRAQTLADVSVLSSARMRVEALEKISERWLEYGRYFGLAADDGSVQLQSVDGPLVQQKAAALVRALPGYLGRTSAVIKVVADANAINRTQVSVEDDAAAQIGLKPEAAILVNEKGHRVSQPGVWISRAWGAKSRFGDAEETIAHRIHLEAPWPVERVAFAKLEWDVNKQNHRTQSDGNGGYPRNWGEARQGPVLAPNRWAVYRAVLALKENAP